MKFSADDLNKAFEQLRIDLTDGRLSNAYNLSKQITCNFPDNPQAQINHAAVCVAALRPEEAIVAATRAFQLDSQMLSAYKFIARAYIISDDYAEALKYSHKFLDIAADDPDAKILCAIALYKLKDLHKAAELFFSAVSDLQLSDSNRSEAYYHLGQCLTGIESRVGEAESYAREAVRIMPSSSLFRMGLANILAQQNREDESIAEFDECLRLNPDFVPAHWNKVRVRKITAHDEDFISSLKRLYVKPNLSLRERALVAHSLAKVFNDLGEYETAVDCWNIAGAAQKEFENFSITVEKLRFAEMYGTYPRSRMSGICEPDSAGLVPIFIVGMPRSGTTLTEQIVGAHSQVTPLGELEYLARSIGLVQKEGLDFNSKGALRKVRETYFEYIGLHAIQNRVFTDKMPLNFRFIPLILNAFPEAKIIHCRRDARAVCFSNFTTYFPANGLIFSCDQEDVANYYALYDEYFHYLESAFKGAVYNLSYEALTASQEIETRSMLQHCDLKFEKGCLSFHKSERAISTASQRQVKQGMYTGSSERWRRYEPWIQPMLQKLIELNVEGCLDSKT